MTRPVSFAGKFLLCIILSLLLADTVLLLGTDIGSFIKPKLVFLIAVLLFIVPYILLPVWQYRERKQLSGITAVNDDLQYILACITGFCIAIFGWKKIFNLQFRTPLSLADSPMSSQSGEDLTWYYFGHSQALGYIIALLQLTGAFLLFFRHTRLAAVCLLMPVMLNISLINIFYQMNSGALIQSSVLTVSLLYLLLQYRKQLISLLFAAGETVAVYKSQWTVAGLMLSFSFIYIFLDSRAIPKESSLYGKYEVKNFSVNGKIISADAGAAKDAVITKVYFDMNNICVLEYSNTNNRLMAKYNFDEPAKVLESNFMIAGKKSLLHMLVDKKNDKQIELKGSFDNDYLKMQLLKITKR